MNNQIDEQLVSDVLRQEVQEQQALNLLLGKLHNKADHHLSLQVQMGEVASYLTSVPLRWVASRVRFAADLPLIKEGTEGSKRIEVDQDTIEMVQQRQPDWSRQLPMTAYLARRNHKFPPLLLVGYQHWVYEEDSDRWSPDGKAMNDSLTLTSLEPSGTYWDLDDSDTIFYALDGQHRLMAILGLHELVATGYLYALDAKRKQKRGQALSIDEVIEWNTGEPDAHAKHEAMQHLMDERIGIEVVPAVLVGETLDTAYRRLRQLFVDVNRHAKKLNPTELAQMEETHGFSIVARRLLHHDLLRSTKGEQGFSRVHMKSQTLSEKSASYTTLHTLTQIAERYLVESGTPPDVSSWRPLVKGVFERPDENGLELGTAAMMEYLDALATLPSHSRYLEGRKASELRGHEGDDNILFRPIVQTALAEAVGKLSRKGISLSTIMSVIADQEEDGQLRLRDPRTPWFGVLCEPFPPYKMRRHRKHEALCSGLFQYLLGGGYTEEDDRDDLRDRFAAERRVDQDKAVDLVGEHVPHEAVRLPRRWN